MRIENVPVAQIDPAPYNPRDDLDADDPDYQAIEASLAEFGLVEPLVWNKQTGHLVGGHQRLKVQLAEGAEAVPCSVVDLDPARERALNLALNKLSGRWDRARLAEVLAELDEEAQALAGFSAEEVAALERELAAEVKAADFQPAELPPGRLDEMGQVCCPECGHLFKPQRLAR